MFIDDSFERGCGFATSLGKVNTQLFTLCDCLPFRELSIDRKISERFWRSHRWS